MHEAFESDIYKRLILEELKRNNSLEEQQLLGVVSNQPEAQSKDFQKHNEFLNYAREYFYEALEQLKEEGKIALNLEGADKLWSLKLG